MRDERGERGVAMVEFALVLPILMLLLVGTISAGSLYNRQLSLAHATREGARYGAILAPDQTFDSGSWASNARDVVMARSGGELTDPAALVCVSLVTGATPTTYAGAQSASWYSTNADGSPCDTTDTYVTSTNDNGLRVQVSVRRDSTLDTGLFSRNVTLKSSAVLQSEYAK